MILSDIPNKQDLIWITSDEVIDARLSGTNAKGRIKLYNENGYCLSISNKKNGYTELFNAINADKVYSIGYNPLLSHKLLYQRHLIIFLTRVGWRIATQ